MKNIKYLIILLMITTLCSCYKDDKVVATQISYPDAPVDNPNDYVDHYIYETYKSTNTIIKYQYDTMEYRYNFKYSYHNFVPQEDKTLLENGLKYYDTVFANLYTEEFKKLHFPPLVFLADSLNIYNVSGGGNILDEISYSNSKYLAIGRIREGLDKQQLIVAKGKINSDFWKYLFTTGKFIIPESFIFITEELNGKNLSNVDKDLDDYENADLREYGFWSYDPATLDVEGEYFMLPEIEADIAQFVFFITTHNQAEMDELMEGFPLIKEKYLILIDYVKSKSGINLQEIGNKAI